MCNIAVEICEQIVLSSTRASKMCLCMCLTERHGAHVYYIRCSYVLELYVLHGDYSNKHKLGKRMCCGGACKVYSSPKYENQYLLISMPFQTGMTFFHLWCSENINWGYFASWGMQEWDLGEERRSYKFWMEWQECKKNNDWIFIADVNCNDYEGVFWAA